MKLECVCIRHGQTQFSDKGACHGKGVVEGHNQSQCSSGQG